MMGKFVYLGIVEGLKPVIHSESGTVIVASSRGVAGNPCVWRRKFELSET